ncbi:hypothetical protein BMS3Abin17_01132 [archaeon BMS3Abin17]|nr:hypothetical protein BMS3Abin17_01132 [archaeon BMS3Abin17]HDZ61218.1 hypothetical protein [Candidatus Pacearchaeota archaeon]
MYPKIHIIYGAIFSLLLLVIYPPIGLIGFSLIFLSSFLIDTDHYLYYVFRKKDWNLKHAYSWFVKGDKMMKALKQNKRINFYTGFYFFHGLETFFLLILLSVFVSKYFFLMLIGVSFHLILDMVDEIKRKKGRIDKISIIYDYFRFKKLKLIQDEK